MAKYISKIFILAVAASVFGLVNFAFAQSDPSDIQFQTDPLFQDGDIVPCHTTTKWIQVTNTSGAVAQAYIFASNFANPLPSDDLSHALTILIKQGSNILYGPATLADFYGHGQIFLSNIENSANAQYDLTISFACEAGNSWKKKTTSFDLVVRLTGEGEGINREINTALNTGVGGNGPLPPSDAYNNWLSQQQNQPSQGIVAGSAIALAPDVLPSIGQVLGESVFQPLSGVLASTGFSIKEFLLIIAVAFALAVLRIFLKRYSLTRN